MDIKFQKRQGEPALGISFFWKMTIDTTSPDAIIDHFIPELFLDYLFIKEGSVKCIDETQGAEYTLPRQALKTIHTRPLMLVYAAPLVFYGVRLSLPFAESFWEALKANCFLSQTWVEEETDDLASFQFQIVEHIRSHQAKKLAYPMFSSDLEESAWLVNFSARHKRRLYKTTFGVSRKDLQNIRNVHSFLEQTCDFSVQNPRIIEHVNPDVFYDQPHLNRTFRKMTGFSPVEYFQANSLLQDNLMSASYNENSSL
jgi:hypothetical protein